MTLAIPLSYSDLSCRVRVMLNFTIYDCHVSLHNTSLCRSYILQPCSSFFKLIHCRFQTCFMLSSSDFLLRIVCYTALCTGSANRTLYLVQHLIIIVDNIKYILIIFKNILLLFIFISKNLESLYY